MCVEKDGVRRERKDQHSENMEWMVIDRQRQGWRDEGEWNLQNHWFLLAPTGALINSDSVLL